MKVGNKLFIPVPTFIFYPRVREHDRERVGELTLTCGRSDPYMWMKCLVGKFAYGRFDLWANWRVCEMTNSVGVVRVEHRQVLYGYC